MNDEFDPAQIKCAAKAYLLFLLGYTIFVNKSSAWVPVVYLKLLINLWEVQEYEWGATALAYLYHQLGSVSRVDVKHMAGYITLLKGWIYKHFPHFTPNCNLLYARNKLRVYIWSS